MRERIYGRFERNLNYHEENDSHSDACDVTSSLTRVSVYASLALLAIDNFE